MIRARVSLFHRLAGFSFLTFYYSDSTGIPNLCQISCVLVRNKFLGAHDRRIRSLSALIIQAFTHRVQRHARPAHLARVRSIPGGPSPPGVFPEVRVGSVGDAGTWRETSLSTCPIWLSSARIGSTRHGSILHGGTHRRTCQSRSFHHTR